MAVWDEYLTEDDRKSFGSRRFRQPRGPGKKNALLLIDMQNTAMGHNRPIWEQLDEFPSSCGPHAWKSIPVHQKLVAAARATGMPVIYTKHIFKPHMALASSAQRADTWMTEIPEEIAMQPGDILVEKQTASAFAYTNLPLILKQHGIDGLLVGGNSTSGCVRATCVDGNGAGVKMQVVEDACFDRIEMAHAAAIFDMQFKIADVITSDQALAVIAGQATRTASAA